MSSMLERVSAWCLAAVVGAILLGGIIMADMIHCGGSSGWGVCNCENFGGTDIKRTADGAICTINGDVHTYTMTGAQS